MVALAFLRLILRARKLNQVVAAGPKTAEDTPRLISDVDLEKTG